MCEADTQAEVPVTAVVAGRESGATGQKDTTLKQILQVVFLQFGNFGV